MKKFIKNNLRLMIGLIIGAILAGGIVYAVTPARDVSYTTAKNGNVKNVEDALNDLYNNSILLWENANPTQNFNEQTLNIDLSGYKYIVISSIGSTSLTNQISFVLCPVLNSDTYIGSCGRANYVRSVHVNISSVKFGRGTKANVEYGNQYAIPLKIYGIRNLDIN